MFGHDQHPLIELDHVAQLWPGLRERATVDVVTEPAPLDQIDHVLGGDVVLDIDDQDLAGVVVQELGDLREGLHRIDRPLLAEAVTEVDPRLDVLGLGHLVANSANRLLEFRPELLLQRGVERGVDPLGEEEVGDVGPRVGVVGRGEGDLVQALFAERRVAVAGAGLPLAAAAEDGRCAMPSLACPR